MTDYQNNFKYLFGPVVSRRYGQSLGVDLILPKTCSFNCIFCQIGETPQTTVTLQELPPIKEVLTELKRWISEGGETDFITVAGSGEPTLHKHFGDILKFTHSETAFQSLLLSNGSLFSLKDVRNQAKMADVVKISLHAWNQESFQKITHADPSLHFDTIIDGYRRFREIYSGKIDLEVFVVPGLNDKTEQMEEISGIVRSFAPDSVYLNSAVRPPADASVKEAPPDMIKRLSNIFGDLAVGTLSAAPSSTQRYSTSALTELISRHPTSLNQLAKQFDIPHDEMHKKLVELEQRKLIELSERNGNLFASPAGRV